MSHWTGAYPAGSLVAAPPFVVPTQRRSTADIVRRGRRIVTQRTGRILYDGCPIQTRRGA